MANSQTGRGGTSRQRDRGREDESKCKRDARGHREEPGDKDGREVKSHKQKCVLLYMDSFKLQNSQNKPKMYADLP